MPRNISFMLTKPQFLDQTKTVTRRMGWYFLEPGDILNGCEKCQGLRKGETIKKLGQIRIVNVRREPLWHISQEDCIAEGFPEMSPWEFIEFFCSTHKGCDPDTEITRIEFEYCESRSEKPKFEQIRLF